MKFVLSYLNQHKVSFLLLSVLILFMLLMNQAHADTGDSIQTLLLDTANKFDSQINSISNFVINAAKDLFLSLAVISVAWSFGTMAAKGGGDFSNFGFEVIRAIMVVGFFWWIISDVPGLLEDSFFKFGDLAASAAGFGPGRGGISSAISSVINTGLQVAGDLFTFKGAESIMNLSLAKVVCSFIGCFFGLLIVLTAVFISINIVIMFIEFLFTCYLGVLVLGLAGASWTRDYAIGYIRKIFAMGLSFFGTLMMCYISIGLAQGCTNSYLVALDNADENAKAAFYELTVIFTSFLIIVKIISVIPNTISGLLGGGSSAGYNPTLAASAATGLAAYGGIKAAGLAMRGAGQGVGYAARGSLHAALNPVNSFKSAVNGVGAGASAAKTAVTQNPLKTAGQAFGAAGRGFTHLRDKLDGLTGFAPKK